MCESIANGGRRCELQTPSTKAKHRKKNQRPTTVAEARVRVKALTAKGLYANAGIIPPITDDMSDAEIEAKRDELQEMFTEHPELNPMFTRKRRTSEEMVQARAAEEAAEAVQPVEVVEPAPRKRRPKAIVSRSIEDIITPSGEPVTDEDSEEADRYKSQAELIQDLNRLKGTRLAAIKRSHASRGETQQRALEEVASCERKIRLKNDRIFATTKA